MLTLFLFFFCSHSKSSPLYSTIITFIWSRWSCLLLHLENLHHQEWFLSIICPAQNNLRCKPILAIFSLLSENNMLSLMPETKPFTFSSFFDYPFWFPLSCPEMHFIGQLLPGCFFKWLLFLLYIPFLNDHIHLYNFSYLSYADDSGLFIDRSILDIPSGHLTDTSNSVSKTESIHYPKNMPLFFLSTTIHLTAQARNALVNLDSYLYLHI